MQSNISSAARSRVSSVRACAHPASTGPMGDSVAALSHGLAIEPVDGPMPASRIVLPIGSGTCRLPRSPWRMRPPGGPRPATAVPGASPAGPAAMRAGIDRPTVFPDRMPIAAAGQGRPRCARTQAMPANRAPLGPSALKPRRARPGAEQDGSEPRLPRPGAHSCLPAKRALASKSISLSLLSRSLPRPGRRRSPAIWKGSAPASGGAAEALLTQSARPDGSTPISRATSA